MKIDVGTDLVVDAVIECNSWSSFDNLAACGQGWTPGFPVQPKPEIRKTRAVFQGGSA